MQLSRKGVALPVRGRVGDGDRLHRGGRDDSIPVSARECGHEDIRAAVPIPSKVRSRITSPEAERQSFRALFYSIYTCKQP